MTHPATRRTRHRPAAFPARRASALALVLASLALATACGDSSESDSSKPAAATYDAAPLDAGAGWLTSQLTDGLVHNDQYDLDDYGLTADFALALDAVGGHDETVQTISDQLADHVDDYTRPGFGTVVSAGATAKSLVVAQAAGGDPTTYGGTDLVAQLEKTVATHAPIEGRVQDRIDTKDKNAADYANVVAQALAVQGLSAAQSPSAAPATDYLLDQQCADGWFRLQLTSDKTAADQTCDGDDTSVADVDATAFAVLALRGQDDDATVAEHLDSAVAWLQSVQAEDGSFAGAAPSSAANSNSTGLAGRALAESGQEPAAERAADWVVRHQLGTGACGEYDDTARGAVAYDDAALAGATKHGITPKATDQFRRSTSGALPVLQWVVAGSVPTGTESGSPC